MWLLPVFHNVASLSLRLYFRASRVGHNIPATGPVLLVANHPNSLLDPAAVAYAAQRPVRFLAKSSLFNDRIVGWLVRGAGSIPVYRRQDDPALMERNAVMFEKVHDALVGGSAVGVFPEGISHSRPSLSELRTGAARIALGSAAKLGGRDFPVVPVGLVFENKSIFRSHVHVIVGEQIHWRDLSGRAEDDAEAVREMTVRIDAALRRITLNLEEWEDAPMVLLAEAVYAAEMELRPDPVERVTRLRKTTELLGRLRSRGSEEWQPYADALTRHRRLLQWFGLTPRSLRTAPTTGAAIGWSLRRIPLAIAGASGVWIAGALLFFIPWRLTDFIGRRAVARGTDLISTTRVIGGAMIFLAWFILLSAATAVLLGVRAGIIALVVFPLLALVTLLVREALLAALSEARRFFRLVRSAEILTELRSRQRDLAMRLDDLWKRERSRSGTTTV